jgi:hypothetical protein
MIGKFELFCNLIGVDDLELLIWLVKLQCFYSHLKVVLNRYVLLIWFDGLIAEQICYEYNCAAQVCRSAGAICSGLQGIFKRQ